MANKYFYEFISAFRAWQLINQLTSVDVIIFDIMKKTQKFKLSSNSMKHILEDFFEGVEFSHSYEKNYT